MKINKGQLQEALAIVKPGLATKELLEQSTSFAFLGNRVATYNDEISISHPVEGLDFRGAIKAEELYGLLSKLNEEEIKIKFKKTELLLSCGKVEAGLKLEEEIILPVEDEIGKIKKWKKIPNPEQFIKHMEFAMRTCSNDMSQVKLTCVCVCKNGYVQGSDGYRLVQCKGEKLPISDFLIPAILVSNIATIAPIEISANDTWIHFRNKEKTIISCRMVDVEYVEQKVINRVLKMNSSNDIEFPEKIESMLDRLKTFAKRDYIFDEQIEVILSEGQMLMKATADVTKSWVKEKAKVNFKGEITFSVTPAVFSDILKDTKFCSLNDDQTKAKFIAKDKSWEYVIMLRAN